MSSYWLETTKNTRKTYSQLSKNQEVGKLELYDGNNKIGTYTLVIKEDINKELQGKGNGN